MNSTHSFSKIVYAILAIDRNGSLHRFQMDDPQHKEHAYRELDCSV
jgi:hypothetical protein